SLHYCVAAAARFGPLRPGHFDLDVLEQGEWRTALGRVALKRAPDIDALYPSHYGARVTMVLADGRGVTHHVQDSLGDPERALAPQAVIDKAVHLMRYGGVPAGRADEDVAGGGALVSGGGGGAGCMR